MLVESTPRCKLCACGIWPTRRRRSCRPAISTSTTHCRHGVSRRLRSCSARACVRACVCVCVRACVCACACATARPIIFACHVAMCDFIKTRHCSLDPDKSILQHNGSEGDRQTDRQTDTQPIQMKSKSEGKSEGKSEWCERVMRFAPARLLTLTAPQPPRRRTRATPVLLGPLWCSHQPSPHPVSSGMSGQAQTLHKRLRQARARDLRLVSHRHEREREQHARPDRRPDTDTDRQTDTDKDSGTLVLTSRARHAMLVYASWSSKMSTSSCETPALCSAWFQGGGRRRGREKRV